MEEWKEYRFTDVASLTNGRAYLQPELQSVGKYKIVRVGNLSGGDKWFYSDMELPQEKYCNKGDLLYAWACSFGPYIWEGDKTIYHYHIWKVDVNSAVADKMFLYYYLKYYTPKWMGFTNGSVMMHITKGSLEKQIVSLPSLPTQQKIASILSSLDDKIEVNRRINEQLEELAQALFKSWFVDFEPFKDGEFVESELGMIPKGWKVGALGDLIEIKYGKDHKKLNDGDIPVYGSGGIMRYVDKSLFAGESVLIPRKGTLNNVMYVNRDFWTVDTMFFSKMKVPNIAIFVYLFLSKKDLASMNSGSAVPSMTVDILNRIQLVIPSDKVFEDYNNVVSSLFAQMSNNSKEILHLTTLRDTLLPKLMSGEMDVNERGIERI